MNTKIIKYVLILAAFIAGASTSAKAGNVTVSSPVPSPAVNLHSVIYPPENLPGGPCVPGTLRNGPDNIPRLCNASATWTFLPGVFRQDGTTISLSDTTSQNYTFYLGPYGGTADQGITIPQNGGIVAIGQYGTNPVLAASGTGTRLIWYPRKAAFRAGIIASGYDDYWNDARIGEVSVAMGYSNLAVGPNSAVLSGSGNQAGRDDLGEVIRILNSTNAVAGGTVNQALGLKTFIGGGHGNIATGAWSTVLGGTQNTVTDSLAFIGGGGDQTAATWNTASSYVSVVAGGQNNTASGYASTVGGGIANNATAWVATVSGGNTNSAADHATVGGGANNTASGTAATILGGASHVASAQASTVGGGNTNQATNINATVLGGTGNIASGFNATVAGGHSSQAAGHTALVLGTNFNVTGDRAIAIGHVGSSTTISQNSAIVLHPRVPGNVGVGTATPSHKLDVNGAGRISGNITTTGNVGVGVAAPTHSLHISEALRLNPASEAPIEEEGVIFFDPSIALCVYVGGAWYNLLEDATGGICPSI